MTLPGMRRVDHVGFTVPDLDEAHSFLVDVLGCEYLYSLGPFQADDDWMTRHLDVHPRAVMVENRWFRCGDQAIFEVFHYTAPDQMVAMPKNSDVGGHHVALYVDDLDAAIAHLRAHDVEIMGEPVKSAGASEGQRWLYFRSPWGQQFELVSFPQGKAYESSSPVRLWHPGHPAE